MAKLNQIIAVEKGIKSETYSALTNLHKAVQKADLFSGFAKNYEKKDEEGEDLPPESKRVQLRANEVVRGFLNAMAPLLDITARKDWSNCLAAANIVVDDQIIVKDVPVTYLLFLEKQLTDIHTFVSALPVLDEAQSWSFDPASGLSRTKETSTHRTKKIQKPIVLYPATPEHPAQTQLLTEDVIVGFWKTTYQSGAMERAAKLALVDRVATLLRAVKEAREAANNISEVEAPEVSEQIIAHLLKS